MNEMKNLTILFICGKRREYPRNAQILKALKASFDVIEITSNKSSYALRILNVALRFLWTSIFKNYDLVYVGFLGQPFVPLVKFFRKRPIILDAFISVYDTLCLDRKDFEPNSILGKVSFWLDSFSFRLADKIVTDTNTHAEYLCHLFNIRRDKLCTIYSGADEEVFYPQEAEKEGNRFIVFFHGMFLPLHGIEYIVRAAKLLKNEKQVLVRIVGSGREKQKILRLSEELGVTNIDFTDWVSYKDLSFQIARADICIGGHFSTIDKAKRVISGKTFLYLSMRKPVVVGNSPAVRELFTHCENIYVCKMADEYSLASAILELKNDSDLRKGIAQAGFELFKNTCGKEKTGEKLAAIIEHYRKK